MKLSQLCLATIGIVCAAIWLGCGDDEDTGATNFTIGPSLLLTTKIAFASDREGNRDIYVMNVDGTDVINITKHEAYDDSPALSPDGQRIAFVSTRAGSDDIYVMKVGSTNAVNISNRESYDDSPDWSPEGNKIVFRRLDGRGSDIYIMNADGTNVVKLTTHKLPTFILIGRRMGKRLPLCQTVKVVIST